MYKVFEMKNDKIEQIIVFGRQDAAIFTEEEQKNIDANSIEVKYVDIEIFGDDSIEEVKRKIIIAYNQQLAFEEIYLFGVQRARFNPMTLYEVLTQKDVLELTKVRLIQFLLNFVNLNIDDLQDKEVYEYSDLLALDLGKDHLVKRPIGQKLVAENMQYQYTVNPFDVITYDSMLKDDILRTNNGELLLNFGELHSNVIYLTKADNVYESSSSPEMAAKIYYPFLNEQQINTVDGLREKRQQLLVANKKRITNKFEQHMENIELMHSIGGPPVPFLTRGIKDIDFTIYSTSLVQIPLDVIFKMFHSSESIPFIKYHPGGRMEKIYRLYANQISSDGRSIPILSKGSIFKLTKKLAKKKGIGMYLVNNDIPFYCNLMSNGSIQIEAEFRELYTIEEVEKKIGDVVNPIINTLSELIEQHGYSIGKFTNLKDKQIEINNINYLYYVPIKKNIKLTTFSGCISSIFNVISDNIKKTTVMRYKRVANFNEMTSQESMIVELVNRGVMQSEIIYSLISNFNLDEEQAKKIFVGFLNEVQIESDLHENRQLRVKENPGFLTTMRLDTHDSNLKFEVSGINNIAYLTHIPIYLEFIIRISQGLYDEEWESKIASVCGRKKLKTEEVIVATEQVKEQPQELLFEEDEGDDDFLDLLGEDEESEEEGDEALDIEFGDDIELGDDIEVGEDIELGDDIEGGTDSPPPADFVGILEGDTPESSDDEEESIRDITGLQLSNPNYFFNRMDKRDPALFLKNKEGKFNAYSRMCPSNVRRQPVILTDKEKERIDREHPGSYEHAINYGSDPDKKYWYICPRYWCIKDNTSLTDEDIDKGACGGRDAIIPFGARKVPPRKVYFRV